MKIELVEACGGKASYMGIGLSYGLTSPYDSWDNVPEETQNRIYSVASKLCKKEGGESKFLRQLAYFWDIRAPRFLWQEIDQYRIGVTTQSESTMHTIMHRELTEDDFESHVALDHLDYLNDLIREYRVTKHIKTFLDLKNNLPEGFLQRRIWMLSLANMKNIYHQRKNHRLPQWKTVLDAFVEATPLWLKGIYNE